VNVWLALLTRHHEHHRVARQWYESLRAEEAGLCRVVQLGMVRLLANPAILGEFAVSAARGWDLMQELLMDERVAFISEPAGLDSAIPPLLQSKIPTGKPVTDAYLAAFAMSASLRLVTLDRVFLQFRGLEAEVLGGGEE